MVPLPRPADRTVSLRVATFNIQHGAGLDGRVVLPRIAQVIEKAGAEVVGLQEVDRHLHERSDFVDQAAWLAGRLGAEVAFGPAVDADPPVPGAPRRQYGNAVLSRHPIRSSTTVALPRGDRPEQRVLVEARIEVAGTIVRVVATHLQNRSADERRMQARALLDHVLGTATGPTGPAGPAGSAVVLADLNARPDAPEVATLTRHLVDAWTAAGNGPGHTYDAATPHARIDYVLVSPDAVVDAAAVVPTHASDHLPVVADLSLPEPGSTVPLVRAG